MAEHSEVAIQHLGVLTVSSTPAQIAAALASAGSAELGAVPMDVDGPMDVVHEEGGIRNRMNSFVAPQGEDPLALLNSSGTTIQNKVPKAVVSDEEEDDDEEDEDGEDDDEDADAESAKASIDVRIVLSHSPTHLNLSLTNLFFLLRTTSRIASCFLLETTGNSSLLAVRSSTLCIFISVLQQNAHISEVYRAPSKRRSGRWRRLAFRIGYCCNEI